jgi:hypothetical protein
MLPVRIRPLGQFQPELIPGPETTGPVLVPFGQAKIRFSCVHVSGLEPPIIINPHRRRDGKIIYEDFGGFNMSKLGVVNDDNASANEPLFGLIECSSEAFKAAR